MHFLAKATAADRSRMDGDGFKRFFRSKTSELDDDCNIGVGKVTRNLKRLQAQRNELNAQGEKLALDTATFYDIAISQFVS